MDVAFVSRLFALLALAALGLAATLAVSTRARALVASEARWLAWSIATVATAGSLYYSEIAGYEPCRLCWYQRIAMYPLVVVLGTGLVTRDGSTWRYGLPLVALGLPISAYHYLVQHVPSLGPETCSATAPCSAAYVWEFGFVSIPFMAGAGFLAIGALLLTDRRSLR